MKGHGIEAWRDRHTGEAVMQFRVDKADAEYALSAVDVLAGEVLEVDLRKWRDKRSLDANAYFHVLVDKLAKATNQGADIVKRNMVERYGTLARAEDGMLRIVVLPAEQDPYEFYDYFRYLRDMEVNGKPAIMYAMVKRTSTLNTKEMSSLIEGTISECKEVGGIETLPPAELERMLNSWRAA